MPHATFEVNFIINAFDRSRLNLHMQFTINYYYIFKKHNAKRLKGATTKAFLEYQFMINTSKFPASDPFSPSDLMQCQYLAYGTYN